jgi:hypothetical protein
MEPNLAGGKKEEAMIIVSFLLSSMIHRFWKL